MKLSNQLLLPEVSSAKTIDDLKAIVQKLSDAVREFHRYTWNDLNSGIVTIAVGGSGTSGRMAKWIAAAQLGNATNTDTDVADAVNKKHANTLDHAQNTDAGTSGNSFFFQSASAEGAWQLVIDGASFKVQRKEGGNWVTKGEFS